jgi:surface polysaccharide O-acyltransferase-like enzyme
MDGMRVVAAGVVVLVHVTAMQVTRGAPDLIVRLLNGLSAWGVPFYLPVSGYLHGRSARAAAEPGAWRLARVRRIAIPYAFWSLAYMAFRVWVSLRNGTGMPHWNPLAVVLIGQANSSLWFLPAVLYAGLLLSLFPSRRSATLIFMLALAGQVVLAVAGGHIPYSAFVYRFPLALASYSAGYMVGTGAIVPALRTGASRVVLASALAVVCGAAIAVLPLVHASAGVIGALGQAATVGMWVVGWLVFVWAAQAGPRTPVARLAPASGVVLGVYASHTLVIMMLAEVIAPTSLAAALWVALVFPVTLVATFSLSAGMARVPALRPLVT